MIYVKNHQIKLEEFLSLLAKTREVCLETINKVGFTNVNAEAVFESMVYNVMKKISVGTEFEGTIERTGKHGFPDIIANKYFGAEVKTTTSDRWTSTGNSVLETTREDGVERIYIFFGKLGGAKDIKYRLYQECLFDIAVTHSPRYKIDMNLKSNQSIFNKMGVEYDQIRIEDALIKKIKEYYRSKLQEGEELWWIDPQSDEKTVSPIITTYNKLSKDTKRKFVLETMILFPEVLNNISRRAKYERAAAYLVTNYNAVSSSLRDLFSASGTKQLRIKNKNVKAPRILVNLHKDAKNLEKVLSSMDEEKLLNYWRVSSLRGSRVDIWKRLLNRNCSWRSNNLLPSDIFEAGLE